MSTNKFSTYNFRIDLGLQNNTVVFFSIPTVMTFPSVYAINGSSKLKKKAIPVRHFGLGFRSGFSGIRELSGFWIGFGYRKKFGFRFRVSKLPVRVWVLGSVCLLSRSVFFLVLFFYSAFSYTTP